MKRILALCTLLTALALPNCSDAPKSYDREGMLRDIAQGLMIPSYERLDQEVAGLIPAKVAKDLAGTAEQPQRELRRTAPKR